MHAFPYELKKKHNQEFNLDMESLTEEFYTCSETTSNIEDSTLKPEIDKFSDSDSKENKVPSKKLSCNKIIIIVLLVISNLGVALVASLQAPFYPAEAESRGASATQYGFVFTSYELVALTISPLYGKYVSLIGVSFLMKSAIFVVSCACISFGFLDLVYTNSGFIGLSIFIRVVESLGGTAYFIASTTVIAQEFPDSIGTTFSFLELCFGLGLIGGPTIGGALFQIGGFRLPFFSLGAFLVIIATIIYFALPPLDGKASEAKAGSLAVLKIFPVTLAIFTLASSSCSMAFMVATIEPHLRQFELSPVAVGAFLAINAGIYALSSCIWGRIVDKTGRPELIYFIGAILTCTCYLLIGPAPFLPFSTKPWVCAVALALHGLGQGGEFVSGFSGAILAAVENGYPDNTATYGMTSSLCTTAFAFGASIGPTLGGIIIDSVGYRIATMAIFSLHAIVAIVSFIYMCRRTIVKKTRNHSEYVTIKETTSLLHHATDDRVVF